MILDFKEIPQANKGGGLQDTFELFARDFLDYLGYNIVEDPDRGADGKRDLIVEEKMEGITSSFNLRWLVSCKHFAHSGSSVKDSDEINIGDRLRQHNCQGFMGVYSTICSSGLSRLLEGVKNDKQLGYVCVYDYEKIEGALLKNPKGELLASRYFNKSYNFYRLENPIPAQIFPEQEPVRCECCGKDLLSSNYQGIYCMFRSEGKSYKSNYKYQNLYCSCKGKCDRILKYRYNKQGLIDCGWNELSDLKIPTLWLDNFFFFIENSHFKTSLSDEFYQKVKNMFKKTFPYISRHLTTNEKERVAIVLS